MVLVLFILEIVGGVLAFVFYPDARQLALESMEFYGTDGEEGQSITAAWDELQNAVSWLLRTNTSGASLQKQNEPGLHLA